jgi:chromosome segregation ATPase
LHSPSQPASAALPLGPQGRIPKLETSTRHQKQHVERLQRELDDWRTKVEPLESKIEDRERTLGDRERQLTRLQRELELLKETRGESTVPMDSVMVNGADSVMANGGDSATDDEAFRRLEEELVGRTVELTALKEALAEHEQRRNEIKGERERQDKWLDILNKQLETARVDNTRLTDELKGLTAARERIGELESTIAALKKELAERDKRLATSRFEVSNARAIAAHLESQLSEFKPASPR